MHNSYSSPDLSFVLDTVVNKAKSVINCHKVGKITSFDASKLTCSVEILERRESEGAILEYPLLINVPLLITSTTHTFLTMADVVGSECIVLFNDTDIDNWFETSQPTVPDTIRLHDLSDGFALLRPFSDVSQIENFAYDLANVVLGTVSTNLEIQDNKIRLHTPANKLQIEEGDNNKIELSTTSNKLEIDETAKKAVLQTTLNRLELNDNSAKSSFVNGTTEINLDALVEIKNATRSLKIILDAWLDACSGIVINPTTLRLADDGASFQAVKAQLAELMK